MDVLPNLAMRMTIDYDLGLQMTNSTVLPFGIIIRESRKFCLFEESFLRIAD